MEQKNKKFKFIHKNIFVFAGVTAIALSTADFASAQLIDRRGGWTPQQQNRASIASMMYQVENSQSGQATGSTAASGQGVTQLVCGSDSGSSAKGNSSCIIISNSNSNIDLGQDSDGAQTATTTETTTTDISEALEDLDG